MNTYFLTATHILCYLVFAQKRGAAATSEEIAFNILLHPSNVRKLAFLLSEKELIRPTQGVKGGYGLAKKAELISLADIYAAVGELNPDFLGVQKMTDKSKKCTTVIKGVQTILNSQIRKIESEMIQSLAQVFISDVCEQTLKLLEVKNVF